jgi:3-dehydroquinate synthase
VRTLTVDLGERSYPIHIGAGLLERGDLLRPHLAGSQVMVISNERVAPLYLDRVLALLDGFQVAIRILPDGEEHKTLATLDGIFDAMLAVPCDRGTTVIALGGGVVGDIAGFAAACYQRGVPYVQLPTTLLAQVDSSVGGKTAVNHPRGKNMIGAFHQPQCVIADTDTLTTLDDRQLRAGVAEVIKYGLIRDVDFFEWLETNIERLLARDAEALGHAIERSCRNKAEVVAADEREGGLRAILNLGHTFGHAIETGMGYGNWLHGEAVAAGMCMAADLSRRMGWLSAHEAGRADGLVERAGLPHRAPAALGTQDLLDLMAVDKKVQAGRLRLVLLRVIGEAVVTDCFDRALLRETLDECRAAA